jgi:hypothetical protein
MSTCQRREDLDDDGRHRHHTTCTYQVVVESAPLGDEERTGDAGELHVLLELVLEGRLDEGQRDLLLDHVLEDRGVPARLHHVIGGQAGQRLLAVEGGRHDDVDDV